MKIKLKVCILLTIKDNTMEQEEFISTFLLTQKTKEMLQFFHLLIISKPTAKKKVFKNYVIWWKKWANAIMGKGSHGMKKGNWNLNEIFTCRNAALFTSYVSRTLFSMNSHENGRENAIKSW